MKELEIDKEYLAHVADDLNAFAQAVSELADTLTDYNIEPYGLHIALSKAEALMAINKGAGPIVHKLMQAGHWIAHDYFDCEDRKESGWMRNADISHLPLFKQDESKLKKHNDKVVEEILKELGGDD